MELVDNKIAKEIQKERKLFNNMNFHSRLFNHEIFNLESKEGNLRFNNPTTMSFNLFQENQVNKCLEKARNIFNISSFFNTRGKYLYKTFCLFHEDEYYFIYIHRVRGDGIDTTCTNSLKYYKFLTQLLIKCGHKIERKQFDQYLNPEFDLTENL